MITISLLIICAALAVFTVCHISEGRRRIGVLMDRNAETQSQCQEIAVELVKLNAKIEQVAFTRYLGGMNPNASLPSLAEIEAKLKQAKNLTGNIPTDQIKK